jgi:hypothetical protein
VQEYIIHLHAKAPAKPAEGAPCNGCGICCALETCPAARLRFLQKKGPCPALSWSEEAGRYHCGLLMEPRTYLGLLPVSLEPLSRRLFARWIAAGLQLVLLKAFLEPLAAWAGRSPYKWLDRMLHDRLPDLK